jgi:hypothetical protein
MEAEEGRKRRRGGKGKKKGNNRAEWVAIKKRTLSLFFLPHSLSFHRPVGKYNHHFHALSLFLSFLHSLMILIILFPVTI